MMRNLILFGTLLLVSLNSYAGFFAEPFFNSVAGGWKQDANITSPTVGTVSGEADTSALQYGGRIGYIWSNFNLGIQISAASGEQTKSKMTTTVSGVSTVTNIADSDFTRLDNGLVIGYKFGPMFRMWFSSLTTHITSTESDGTKTKYKGITGLFGFGWKVGSYVSINLELGGTKYTEEDGKQYSFSATSGTTTISYNAPTESMAMIGISVPLGLY